MTFFAMLLLVAALGHALARATRLPTIPILLLCGMGFAALGVVPEAALPEDGQFAEAPLLRFLEFCLAFLVFASGVELTPRRFSRHRRAVAWIAAVQFLLAAAAGFGVALWMGFDLLVSCYVAAAVAASSTLVGLRQLRARRAMFEPFGRVVTGVLLVQDVVLIVVIVLMMRLAQGAGMMAAGLGALLLLAAVAFLCQQKVVPALLRRFRPDEELLLLWIVAFLFLFIGLAVYLFDLPMIAGAFFAGILFSGFPLNGLVRGQLTSLSDFFLALFFVCLGVVVGVPGGEVLWQALGLSLVVVVVTPPVVTAVAEWRGMHTRPAVESGLLLAQTSEFSLVLALSGVLAGHLTAGVFQVIALTAVITMTLTPFIGTERMAHALLPLHPLRRRRPLRGDLRGHVLVLGFGSAGMWVVKPLRAAGHEVVVVDDDAVVCAELMRLGIHTIRGDGSDEHTLAKVGASEAKLVICSMRRVGDALKVLEHSGEAPVLVRVLEEADARLVERAGGTPILSAKPAAETFLQWFEKKCCTEDEKEEGESA